MKYEVVTLERGWGDPLEVEVPDGGGWCVRDGDLEVYHGAETLLHCRNVLFVRQMIDSQVLA